MGRVEGEGDGHSQLTEASATKRIVVVGGILGIYAPVFMRRLVRDCGGDVETARAFANACRTRLSLDDIGVVGRLQCCIGVQPMGQIKMLSQTTTPLRPGAVLRPNREDPALCALRNLIENLPTWIKQLGGLMGETQKRQIELARLHKSQDGAPSQLELIKDGESTEPFKVDDGPQAHTAVTADVPRPPLQKTGFLSPPIEQQLPSPSSSVGHTPSALRRQTDGAIAVAQTKAGAAAQRKRTDSSIGGEGSTITVYYDTFVQSFFEELVKFVSASRFLLRKPKMAAKVTAKMARETDKDAVQASKDSANRGLDSGAIEADTQLETARSDNRVSQRLEYVRTRRMRPPRDQLPDNVYDVLDKDLESAQADTEGAAYQFLRNGDCSEEIVRIRQRLQDAQELASTEVGRMVYPVLNEPPPMDNAWVQYEQDAGPQPTYAPLEKQFWYPQQCRDLHEKMMAPGARDFHLSEDVTVCWFTVPSERDGFPIPVIQYDLVHGNSPSDSNKTVVVYYHGGGLKIGEADSEDLSCRRILKESGLPNLTVYSVGYRLKPQVEAAVCFSDSLDAFNYLRRLHRVAKVLVVGSSSGGQLAALVSQTVPSRTLDGARTIDAVVLRCPVTSDAFNGQQYVPKWLRPLHTTAWNMEFRTSLLGVMKREVPRDGLERMPLEASRDDLRGQPPHWIQLCTNDMLYSDGMCYAVALMVAGVEVQVDMVVGWPHTFWLVAPHLPEALAADHAMLKWLRWLAGRWREEALVADQSL